MTSSSSFSFSNNLVEIGALTVLVGSSVAESLVLGTRGAAGIAWAAMSAFGAISVAKACVCGASSGWLRETLGIRGASCDSAVGLELRCDSSRAETVRLTAGEPLAIFCRKPEAVESLEERKPPSLQHVPVMWSDVYALDYCTSFMLRSIPDSGFGSRPQVFTYGKYPFRRVHDARSQIPTMLLSVTKVVEVYMLWIQGAALLGVVSATPWLFFFIGAIVIQAHDMVSSRHPESELGKLDIIGGQLPMVGRQGAGRKIILGAVDNARGNLIWRAFWATGAVISVVCIVFSYYLMGYQPRSTVFVWAGFQLFWLGVRIVVSHIISPTNPMALRALIARPWDALPRNLKDRVVDLTFALGHYQSFIHPRGRAQYRDDAFSLRDGQLIIDGLPATDFYPLRSLCAPTVSVEIKAVFGDTSLSSAMWMTGSSVTPLDLYDSCIVVFSVRRSTAVNGSPTSHHTVAVPAVRVFGHASSNGKTTTFDAEHHMPVFVPRATGQGNSWYGDASWWYWIPCDPGHWLQIQVPTEDVIVGVREAELRTDAQVSALLTSGYLNVSLKDVDEIKQVVELSRKARDSLIELLS